MKRLGPWVVRMRWWMPFPSRTLGITLYPFIVLRSGWTARTMRHELVHVLQCRRIGVARFYWRYLTEWLGGTPYVDLDAEIEAYDHENDPAFLPDELEMLVHADPRGTA